MERGNISTDIATQYRQLHKQISDFIWHVYLMVLLKFEFDFYFIQTLHRKWIISEGSLTPYDIYTHRNNVYEKQ